MAGLAKDPSARPQSAAAFAEALRLEEGVAPPHLVAGAESAVAPVVVGVHATTPEPGGHTQFVTLSPNTPPAPAVVPKGTRGRGGRPAWLLPAAAAAALVVLVIVVVMTTGGRSALSAPQPSLPSKTLPGHSTYDERGTTT
jgi:serine/threonine-protein kinase